MRRRRSEARSDHLEQIDNHNQIFRGRLEPTLHQRTIDNYCSIDWFETMASEVIAPGPATVRGWYVSGWSAKYPPISRTSNFVGFADDGDVESPTSS